jgi:hypothetical protein
MRSRIRALFPGLLLAGLVACGGAPTATSGQAVTSATATPGAASAPFGTATPPGTASAPGAAPTIAVSPTAPPAAAAIGTRAPGAIGAAPGGTIPPGWRVYRGPAEFPVALAYPPDWTVDDSYFPGHYVLFLYGPDGREEEELIQINIGGVQPDANIDVLRDEFFRVKSDFCERKRIEYTEHRRVAGATFAILGATCESSDRLSFLQVASGLKDGDEWDVLMQTPYARREARLREVFDPMLASLNVYARIPR